MKKLSFFQLVGVILVICVGVAVLTLTIDNKIENKKVSNVVKSVHTLSPKATATIVATSTPWPSPTLDPTSVQDSYGFYRSCIPDTIDSSHCICTDYNYTIHIERDNCGSDLCPAKIEFTSEYGDGTTMWVDYYDSQKSIMIHNGEVIDLPSLDSTSWSIGPRSFFDLSVTPEP